MYELDGAEKNDWLRQDTQSWQPAFDGEALKRIGERLRQAKADLERAEMQNDTVEAEHCREEIEKLTRELSSSTGIGGKQRDLNNPLDKLRPKIEGTLTTAYEKLRGANPSMKVLADHFENAIGAEIDSYIYSPAGTAPKWADTLE